MRTRLHLQRLWMRGVVAFLHNPRREHVIKMTIVIVKNTQWQRTTCGPRLSGVITQRRYKVWHDLQRFYPHKCTGSMASWTSLYVAMLDNQPIVRIKRKRWKSPSCREIRLVNKEWNGRKTWPGVEIRKSRGLWVTSGPVRRQNGRITLNLN